MPRFFLEFLERGRYNLLKNQGNSTEERRLVASPLVTFQATSLARNSPQPRGQQHPVPDAPQRTSPRVLDRGRDAFASEEISRLPAQLVRVRGPLDAGFWRSAPFAGQGRDMPYCRTLDIRAIYHLEGRRVDCAKSLSRSEGFPQCRSKADNGIHCQPRSVWGR